VLEYGSLWTCAETNVGNGKQKLAPHLPTDQEAKELDKNGRLANLKA